jgi:hypothetical protein
LSYVSYDSLRDDASLGQLEPVIAMSEFAASSATL